MMLMIRRILLLTSSSALIAYLIFLGRELILYSSDYVYANLLVIPLSLSLQIFFSMFRIYRIYSVVGIAFSIIFLELILFSYLSIFSKIVLLLGTLLEIQIALWPRKIFFQSIPIYFAVLFYSTNQLWGDERIFILCMLLLISLLLNSKRIDLGILFTAQIMLISLTIFTTNMLIFLLGTALVILTSIIYRFIMVKNK